MDDWDDDENDFRQPDPDWGRIDVHSRAMQAGKPLPLGESIKWGGEETTHFGFAGSFPSPTIVRAQTTDAYPRLWAAIGTVRARTFAWGVPAADWSCVLHLSQGAGQATLTQAYDLRLLTTIGLAVYAPVQEVVPPDTFETRSFAIIGGIIGQAIEGRVIQTCTLAAGFTNEFVTTRLIMTPLAAGTGL